MDMLDRRIGDTEPTNKCSSLLDHLLRQVCTMYRATRADQLARYNEVETGPAADVQHNAPRFYGSKGKRIAHATEAVKQLIVEPVQDVCRITEGSRTLPSGWIPEFTCRGPGCSRVAVPDRTPDPGQLCLAECTRLQLVVDGRLRATNRYLAPPG